MRPFAAAAGAFALVLAAAAISAAVAAWQTRRHD